MSVKQTPSVPRAVVHKQILDAAETHPDASLNELVSQVSGATVELVERVLDTYGDPCQEHPPEPAATESSSGQPTTPPESVRVDDLTEKQRETLRLIYENPTASQRDIAAKLGVTHAAVYQRLRPIRGFEWADRWTFVTILFDPNPHDPEESADPPTHDPRPLAQPRDGKADPDELPENPQLTIKVLRACMEADTITDDELYHIMTDLLNPPANHPTTPPPASRS